MPQSDGINKQSLADWKKKESKGILIKIIFKEVQHIIKERLLEKISEERPSELRNLLLSMQN